MPTVKVTPECRYGHGPLQNIQPEAPTPGHHFWGLQGVTLTPFRAGSPAATPLLTSETTSRIYSVMIFRCPTCGYVELFDDEAFRG